MALKEPGGYHYAYPDAAAFPLESCSQSLSNQNSSGLSLGNAPVFY